MFTGLIETVGTVLKVDRRGAAARLVVTAPFPHDEVSLGDSIAVNGICLTLIEIERGAFAFDVSPETLTRGGFKNLGCGSRVNLERALRLGDRLGGHIVTGHVDCSALVTERREVSGNIVFTFKVPGEFSRYLVPKGSVAIDGISLTVNGVTGDSFSVNVIPHTAIQTTLQVKKPGDEVNIETDILGKYVERLLTRADKRDGVTLDLLAKNGFL